MKKTKKEEPEELDRPRNRIGSTGWDMLNDDCCDIDLVTATLNRYNV